MWAHTRGSAGRSAGTTGGAGGAGRQARPNLADTGVYCLTPSAGVPVVESHAVASVELGASSGDDLFVFPWADVNQCPAGTLEVQTYDLGGPDPGDPEPSNDVAFSVIIP